MKYSHKKEDGQATLELCIGLLGIVFVIIAVLYFGGIGITGIKTLLNARYNAELRASSGNASAQGSTARQNIQSWQYTSAKYKNSDELEIPFLAHDAPNGGRSFQNDFFHNPAYSSGSMPEDGSGRLQYDFIPMHDETAGIRNYNGQVDSGDPANLANLRTSGGVLPEELEKSGEEIYTMCRTGNAGKLKQNLRKNGFFDFTSLKIIEWRSNIAAYPVFKGKE